MLDHHGSPRTKGIVSRRKVGKAFHYQARLSADEARGKAVEKIVEGFFDGSAELSLRISLPKLPQTGSFSLPRLHPLTRPPHPLQNCKPMNLDERLLLQSKYFPHPFSIRDKVYLTGHGPRANGRSNRFCVSPHDPQPRRLRPHHDRIHQRRMHHAQLNAARRVIFSLSRTSIRSRASYSAPTPKVMGQRSRNAGRKRWASTSWM